MVGQTDAHGDAPDRRSVLPGLSTLSE